VTIRKRIAAADQILLSWGAAAGRPGLDRAMQGLGQWTVEATADDIVSVGSRRLSRRVRHRRRT